MKIKHNVPTAPLKSAVLSEQYENEVRRSTQRGEREYARAQKRVTQAERRLAKIRATPEHARAVSSYTRDLNVAVQIVELRRQELAALERIMKQSPQSATHRGTKSFRPVGGAQ